jgi:L-aspartate oxidase
MEQGGDFALVPLENPAVPESGEPLDTADIRNSLKALMWRNAGIRRDQARLEEARDTIAAWNQYVLPRQFREPSGWQLQNMLTIAELMVAAALEREESRGVHLRTDFPRLDDAHWRRRITFRQST